MKCRHRRTSLENRHLSSGHMLVYEQCVSCWRWLPLGPSDETPVAVEVRAADLSDLARSHATTSESHGWWICRRDDDLPPGMEEDAEYLAGWLGRVIFEHGREQEHATATERLVEVCARTYAEERAAVDWESTQ